MTSKKDEKLIKFISDISTELHNAELTISNFSNLQSKVKEILKKVAKSPIIKGLGKGIDLTKISHNPKGIGKKLLNNLKDWTLENACILRNIQIICFRMAAIVEGKDMRIGNRYAGKPKNGKRVIEVASKLGVEYKDSLRYPILYSDGLLWYPGFHRSKSYKKLLKSGKCPWKKLCKELDAFEASENPKDDFELEKKELKKMRQFFSWKKVEVE